MSRIRTVKPELFKHEDLFEAERQAQLPLRLAFIALLTVCDREGRFRWRPRRLKLDMLPYDEVNLELILDALLSYGFIKKYTAYEETYGYIPSWSRHQKVNHRELKSDIPAPSEVNVGEISLSQKTDEVSVVDQNNSPESRLSGTIQICPTSGIENRQSINTVVPPAKQGVDLSSTCQVFEHWKTVMNHPQAKLDTKREVLIQKSLKAGYSIEELCYAITGCSLTPHNIGDNERGQRYDGLHVILRDSDQIDRFIHNCHYPPRPFTQAERKTHANIHTLQHWANKKLAEISVNGSA